MVLCFSPSWAAKDVFLVEKAAKTPYFLIPGDRGRELGLVMNILV